MNLRRRRIRFAPGAILIFFVLLAAIILTAILASRPENKVGYHITYDGVSGQGLLVRTETMTDLSQYEKIVYENLVDGQKIAEGDALAAAYKRGYLKNTLAKLQETERSIVNYQNQTLLPPYDDRTIAKMDFDAEVLIGEMAAAEGGYIELYDQLCKLMEERQAYIQENYDVSSNIYMQELLSDERDYLESLRAWCDTFTASSDGFIGFYCDGLEETLRDFSPDDFDGSDLKDLLKKERKEQKGFKIVKDDVWYLAVNVPSRLELDEGAAFSVYIGASVEAEPGTLVKAASTRQGTLLIFRFNDHVEKYLNTRVTEVFIGQRYAGMTVPVKALKGNTVTVKDGKTKRQVTVEPFYTDHRYAYFAPTDDLIIGQKVVKK